jgi:hypothetical protein
MQTGDAALYDKVNPSLLPDAHDAMDFANGKFSAAMAAKRVLLVASAGGHWIELARLSEAFDGHDVQYVSTAAGACSPSGGHKVRVIADGSRSSPHKLIMAAFELSQIMRTFRPELVVTTGAAPGLVALLVGKLHGARTIWVDSIANSEKLSLSGRIAEGFADLWLTQWLHLTARHPRLQYHGQIL